MRQRWICINCLVAWTSIEGERNYDTCWSCKHIGYNCFNSKPSPVTDPWLLAMLPDEKR